MIKFLGGIYMYTYFISYAINDLYAPITTFRNCVITLNYPLDSEKKLCEVEKRN